MRAILVRRIIKTHKFKPLSPLKPSETQKSCPQKEFEFYPTGREGLDSTKSKEIEDQLYDMLVWSKKVA
jgi:hypothetical protein